MVRKQTKQVSAGTLKIGGGAPISVQSMLNVPADDIAGSVAQAKALEAAGCELIRAAQIPKRFPAFSFARRMAGLYLVSVWMETSVWPLSKASFVPLIVPKQSSHTA